MQDENLIFDIFLEEKSLIKMHSWMNSFLRNGSCLIPQRKFSNLQNFEKKFVGR